MGGILLAFWEGGAKIPVLGSHSEKRLEKRTEPLTSRACEMSTD